MGNTSWENPNYTDTTARSSAIVSINILSTALATLIVVLRLFTRGRILKAVGVDDWLILAGLLLAWVLAGWNCVGTGYGLGRHKWDIKKEYFEAVGKVIWGTTTLYIPVVGFIKLSILFSSRRITPTAFNRNVIYTMIGVVIALTLSLTFATIFQCTPLRKIYEFEPSPEIEKKHLVGLDMVGVNVPGKCINREALFYSGGALNIVTDLIILGIPIPMLLSLGLPKKQKALLIGVFSMGGLACVASMVRLAMIREVLNSPDPTWEIYKLSISSCVEISLGLICASIPALKPFLSRYLPFVIGHDSHSRFHRMDNSTKRSLSPPNFLSVPSRPASWYTPVESEEAQVERGMITNPHKYRTLASRGDGGGGSGSGDEDDTQQMTHVAVAATPIISYTSLVKGQNRDSFVDTAYDPGAYINRDSIATLPSIHQQAPPPATIPSPPPTISKNQRSSSLNGFETPPPPPSPHTPAPRPITRRQSSLRRQIARKQPPQNIYQESPVIPITSPQPSPTTSLPPNPSQPQPITTTTTTTASRIFPTITTPSTITFSARTTGPLTPPSPYYRGSPISPVFRERLSNFGTWGKDKLSHILSPTGTSSPLSPSTESGEGTTRYTLARRRTDDENGKKGGKLVMVPKAGLGRGEIRKGPKRGKGVGYHQVSLEEGEGVMGLIEETAREREEEEQENAGEEEEEEEQMPTMSWRVEGPGMSDYYDYYPTFG